MRHYSTGPLREPRGAGVPRRMGHTAGAALGSACAAAIERFGPYSLHPYSNSPTTLCFSGLGADVRATK
jgi:hypothetical protein